jgi:hypothetical protein
MADPKKYHDEAERLRKDAAETIDVDARKTMIDIAKLYDRLADTLSRQRRDEFQTDPTTPTLPIAGPIICAAMSGACSAPHSFTRMLAAR